MDWKKAKHILLIALILLNLLLYRAVVQKRELVGDINAQEKVEILRESLEQNDIQLETDIPTPKRQLYALEVYYEEYTPEDLNRQYFHDRGRLSSISEDVTEIIYSNERLTISYGRILDYQNTKPQSGKILSQEETVDQVVKPFLREMGISLRDMELIYAIPTADDTGWYLEFGKVHDNMPLEKSRTSVQTAYDQVYLMHRQWLDVKGKVEGTMAIESPINQLFTLVNSKEHSGKTIVNMQLCHYFDVEQNRYVEDIYSIAEGRALPAWLITFEDQSRLILTDWN